MKVGPRLHVALGSRVGVIAVGIDGQRAVRALNLEKAVGEAGIRSARALDRCDRRTVRAFYVDSGARGVSRTDRRDNVAVGGQVIIDQCVRVVVRRWNVVDDLHRQRIAVGIAVGVRQDNLEILEQRILVTTTWVLFIVEQRVGVGDLARRRIVSGEGQRVAEGRVDMRTHLEYAVHDHVHAANRQTGDAVGR